MNAPTISTSPAPTSASAATFARSTRLTSDIGGSMAAEEAAVAKLAAETGQ